MVGEARSTQPQPSDSPGSASAPPEPPPGTDINAVAESDLPEEASLSWRQVWQLPTLVVSLGLLSLGLLLLLNTRPPNEYAELLANAEAQTESGQYESGLKLLEEIEAHLGDLTILQQARYHQARGDLFYLKQRSEGGDADANYQEAIRQYRTAEELGLPLEGEHLYRITDSLISLAMSDTALDYYDRIPSTDSDRRHRILKRLVERNLSSRRHDFKRTYELLGQLLEEPDLSDADRVWAEARMAELRMEQGFVDEAINGLLLAIQQLKAENVFKLPELYVLLGRGYFEIGNYDASRDQLNRAQEFLPAADALRGEALLYLGRIAQAEGDWDRALALYDLIVSDFPGTSSHLPGLLGRAEIYAQTGRYQASVEDFDQLVNEVARRQGQRSAILNVTPQELTESLITWHDRMIVQDRLDLGLRFLKLAERLYADRDREMPDDLRLRLAETHSMLGDHTLAAARDAILAKRQADRSVLPEPGGKDEAAANTGAMILPEEIRLDPATKQEARRHFIESGIYYRKRAEALQVDRPEETVTSLRLAAEAFDEGGDLKSAVDCLKEYIRLTANDPRQVDGIFMLGRVYQALDDHAGAIEQFKKLLQNHPNTLQAHRAYVLLAESHLQDLDNPNPQEAERLLQHVVSGEAGLTPDAPEFADALILLGTLYTRAEEYGLPRDPGSYYPEAIRRLTEAIERYPNHPHLTDVYFKLGHAYRLSAEEIDNELQLDMPDADRRSLAQLREEHMQRSMEAYRDAIDRYEQIPAHKRTRVEDEQLKFARLWRADAAFSLGDLDKAIALYNEVVEEYEDDVVALVALVQIINSYAEMGDFRAAKAAQNRARRQLKELQETSPQAFDEGLLNREAWERWLSWERTLDADEMTSAESPG